MAGHRPAPVLARSVITSPESAPSAVASRPPLPRPEEASGAVALVSWSFATATRNDLVNVRNVYALFEYI
jgi:hypothetical protein